MKLNREAVFLGIIIGTPFATIISNNMGLDPFGGFVAQMLTAGFCIVWYIQSFGNKTEETQ